mgnify:CR=1 FL=1
MIQLPPMKIAQGEPWGYDFTVEGQSWEGYTGTATFKRSVKAITGSNWYDDAVEPIVTVDVVSDAAGLIQIALTPAQTALFPALDRQGYFRQAMCEVNMTDGADVQKFQARVMVAASV